MLKMFRDNNHIKPLWCLSLFILFSCGPRSGIHNNNKEETAKEKETQWLCGNAISAGSGAGEKLFKLNCAVCHASNTDQKLTGPGLKDVFTRIPKPSEEWFINYTLNCDSVLKAKDAYAKKLRKNYPGERMTVFSGYLTRKDVEEIMYFVKGR
jgi:cytochrome c2